jgi:hypothetical protein
MIERLPLKVAHSLNGKDALFVMRSFINMSSKELKLYKVTTLRKEAP